MAHKVAPPLTKSAGSTSLAADYPIGGNPAVGLPDPVKYPLHAIHCVKDGAAGKKLYIRTLDAGDVPIWRSISAE
jgi:hypothetical protein